MWLEEVLLGICSDLLFARAVRRGKGVDRIDHAMSLLKGEIASLGARL
jgi:hypothetical protein